MNNSQTENTGVTAAVLGMILGFVALLGGIFVFFICAGWASFEGGLFGALVLGFLWTAFSSLCLVMSMVGRTRMIKAGKSGVLGITGIIIGILAVILSIGIIGASYAANNAL
jgi:hypothetical protein